MLVVDHLCFEYAQGQHFDWSFQLLPGQCMAITGVSGAGKSTLLQTIAGFLTPTAGTLTWQGQDLLPLSPWQRPVTSVFQSHNLFAHLDVMTNIALGLDPGGRLTSEQVLRVRAMLSQVGLAGVEQRLPEALSGGQQQRVTLVRALLRSQPLLLLDEPMTGLDSQNRAHLHELFIAMKQQGYALLLVSHDASDVQVLADCCYQLIDTEAGVMLEPYS